MHRVCTVSAKPAQLAHLQTQLRQIQTRAYVEVKLALLVVVFTVSPAATHAHVVLIVKIPTANPRTKSIARVGRVPIPTAHSGHLVLATHSTECSAAASTTSARPPPFQCAPTLTGTLSIRRLASVARKRATLTTVSYSATLDKIIAAKNVPPAVAQVRSVWRPMAPMPTVRNACAVMQVAQTLRVSSATILSSLHQVDVQHIIFWLAPTTKVR